MDRRQIGLPYILSRLSCPAITPPKPSDTFHGGRNDRATKTGFRRPDPSCHLLCGLWPRKDEYGLLPSPGAQNPIRSQDETAHCGFQAGPTESNRLRPASRPATVAFSAGTRRIPCHASGLVGLAGRLRMQASRADGRRMGRPLGADGFAHSVFHRPAQSANHRLCRIGPSRPCEWWARAALRAPIPARGTPCGEPQPDSAGRS